MKTRFLIICMLVISMATQALALRIETGSDIRITTPVYEDVYVFAGSIQFDAPVHGDIWCAGGTVTVNDSIYGDLVAAGGNLYLRGVVLDDVRAAGGTLVVSGRITGDLLIAGGTVMVERGADILGDVATSGGTLTLDSNVAGYLKASGEKVTLNGAIGKDFEFNGGELYLNGVVNGASRIAANKLQVGDRTALNGNVRYWTDQGETDFGTALQNGASATFDPSLHEHFERPDYKFLGFASALAVLWYLCASFILLWLGQWLFADVFNQAAGVARSEPSRSLGYGFLYFVGVPVGIVLLLVTIIGIPVGLILLFLFGLLLALANIITALIGAHWINRQRNYQWRPFTLVSVGLAILIGLKIIGSIPFAGWIVHMAVVFIAFGSILYNLRIFRRSRTAIPIN